MRAARRIRILEKCNEWISPTACSLQRLFELIGYVFHAKDVKGPPAVTAIVHVENLVTRNVTLRLHHRNDIFGRDEAFIEVVEDWSDYGANLHWGIWFNSALHKNGNHWLMDARGSQENERYNNIPISKDGPDFEQPQLWEDEARGNRRCGEQRQAIYEVARSIHDPDPVWAHDVNAVPKAVQIGTPRPARGCHFNGVRLGKYRASQLRPLLIQLSDTYKDKQAMEPSQSSADPM